MGDHDIEARPHQGAGRTPQNRRSTKLGRVLNAFAQGGSWNRFEAAQELHDTCLHSTVAEIERRGIAVDRKMETVPGYQGKATRCCRYWLNPEALGRARELLGEEDIV